MSMNSILCKAVVSLSLVTSICSHMTTTSARSILNRPDIMRESEVITTHKSSYNPVSDNNEPYCNLIRDSDGNVIGVSFNNLSKGDTTKIDY